MRYLVFILSFTLLNINISNGSEKWGNDSLRSVLESRTIRANENGFLVFDVLTPRTEIKDLFAFPAHPAFDSLLTPEKKAEIRRAIEARCDEIGKDSLLTADLFYVMRPYFDWLHHIDPHFRIWESMPIGGTKRDFRRINKSMKCPAFNVVVINDTVVINRSIDPLFMKGDMLLSVNGIPVSRMLPYAYEDRYNRLDLLMRYYYFSYPTSNYTIRLIRNGSAFTVNTSGEATDKAVFDLDISESMDNNIRRYKNARCGYIAIPKFFPNNDRLFKLLRSSIRQFKTDGCTSVILDLRKNQGGSGHNFDKILSIFIDKPTIPYLKNQRLKVSEETLQDYDFLTTDSLGKVVEIPRQYVTTRITLDPACYVGDMKYYVFGRKDTGSIAASFCNILQFNDAASLVGEPLLHNALKYGEEINGEALLPTLLIPTSISTVEFDEYTCAVDGVLMPDIVIPYVARDYLSGRDAMLDKLLEIIESNPIN